jgi:alkaline phosphatase D
LSTLGESPLSGHPIRVRRIPGQSTRYVAERNLLTLSRDAGAWQARWYMESSGLGQPLAL